MIPANFFRPLFVTPPSFLKRRPPRTQAYKKNFKNRYHLSLFAFFSLLISRLASDNAPVACHFWSLFGQKAAVYKRSHGVGQTSQAVGTSETRPLSPGNLPT